MKQANPCWLSVAAVDMRLFGAVTVLVLVVIVDGRRHTEEYAESRGRGYRLHYDSRSWRDARDRCAGAGRGGKLAVPKNEAEFKVIQSVVRKMHYPSVQSWSGSPLAWVGVSNLGDYRTWRNVDGEDIRDTGYSTWAGKSSWENSEDPKEPHCAAVDPANTGLRPHWCHHKLPFVCEHPLNRP